ncbi:MAG: protein-glutamate O-methyltransferase CheR [Eubacterium sp.]
MQPTLSDRDFIRLSEFIQKNYGINLTQKRQLITSRLASSIQARGYSDFAPFVEHLLTTKDASEMTLLLDKLTTNYTFFMREKGHFDFFQSTILPNLIEKHQKDKTLSIWSAGCSTGEEPYNIAMYLLDYLGTRASGWDTRILATDISNRVLEAAKKGVYELPDTLPAGWKQKYFLPAENGRFQVAPAVRNNVIFQSFNLMSPIRFRQKFDLIFCRNVMIYFDQPTKDALVTRFYDATAPGGYLLIGFSENLSLNSPYHRLGPSTFQK